VCSGSTAGEAWRVRRMGLWSFLTELVPLTLLALQCVWAFAEPWAVGKGLTRGPGMQQPARVGRSSNVAVQQLVGRWYIQERHNMDEFLQGLGFSSFQRSLLSKAGQETKISESSGGESIAIATSDLRGTSTLELPLSGDGVVANDGDGGATVTRNVAVDRGAVVVTERLAGDKLPLSVCKRKVAPDGRMVIDVSKRTPEGKTVEMTIIAARKNDP